MRDVLLHLPLAATVAGALLLLLGVRRQRGACVPAGYALLLLAAAWAVPAVVLRAGLPCLLDTVEPLGLGVSGAAGLAGLVLSARRDGGPAWAPLAALSVVGVVAGTISLAWGLG